MNIQFDPKSAPDVPAHKTRVAIIGGGPGGLFTARHLAGKAGDACEIIIFEASERPGGKIVTGQFSGVGPYEAGVAEIYDYSSRGPDPLRELIVDELGLEVKHIAGGPCVVNDKIILSPEDLATHFGERTRDEVLAFRAKCAEMLSPEAFYLSVAEADNAHPWSQISGEALLAREIGDETARRYVRAMAHSDVSAAPHQTNGLTYLKNVLMDVDGYMDIYSVIGGNEQIVERLVDDLDADLRLNSPVRSVEPLGDGTYRLEVDSNGFVESHVFDYVVLALPLTALSMIAWRSTLLQETVDRHIAYFDRPGHYLRATLLFERPFWREHIPADWFMLDAFDGCCVYDESARHDFGKVGALAFLIAGNAALSLANVSDARIERMCLDALPPQLAEASDLLLDRRIHRWMASVNALPGGLRTRRRAVNHRPEPRRLPGVLMVGDYLFDATLNGVLDSADAATDIIMGDMLRARRASQTSGAGVLGADQWSNAASTEETLDRFFPAEALGEMLCVAFGVDKGARVLHIGSASGRMVAALRAFGLDAHGVESNRLAHAGTAPENEPFNRLGDLDALPFEDGAFDVVVETGLCRLAPQRVARAISEIRRVGRRGMLLGSVTTDLPIDLIERHDLLDGVQTLASRWDWSEKLYAAGFTHALMDQRLDEVWKRAVETGAGAGHWYEDAESVLYCFYRRGEAPAASAELEDENAFPVERIALVLPGAA
ncbi:MAG TPA: FAD-dependent oxidoreductase [Methylosinus sp.]|jgi:monoamine oxidase/SAM-dependent methyltransferase